MTMDDDALSNAYNSALAAEKSGQFDEAAELYRRCLEIDPDDRCGASVRLASMGLGATPDKAPDAYVATLFNQHADDFDDILTGDLGYAVPSQLADWLKQNMAGPYERLVDLGCGTGLSGMMLQELAAHATGVDISENMVERADERAAYDDLFVNEAVHFLEQYARSEDAEHTPFDLIVATDVLPYIGALEPLFDGIAANATEEAVLAFSSETLALDAFGDQGWSITPHQRYAHHPGYLLQMLERAGFRHALHFEHITVRLEQGKPIAGFLVVAAR